MNEEELKASLKTYHQQLNQVESVLLASGTEHNEDLVKLQGDLKELINLTQDSLLSLEKSKLLMLIDGAESLTSSIAQPEPQLASTSLDEEFDDFKKVIAETNSITETEQNSCSLSQELSQGNQSHDDNNTVKAFDSQNGSVNTPGHDNSDIVGTKCRVVVKKDWAPSQYHNAMIVCLEELEDEDEPKVRVLFCNPTHTSMLPCPYYLEDKCRFTDNQCRYSHGHVVEVQKLEEFLEPDYSELVVGASCLAKDTDGIWYKATVVDTDTQNHTYHVMYTENQAENTVVLADIIPTDNHDDDDNPSSTHSSGHLSDPDDQPEEEMPVMLWQPGMNSMGEWESHTKGIGSKLMMRMGYISGQGLGKNQHGRVEPVPIQLLPSGKSLDKIMELKAIAGDQNLYDVMKKQKRQQRKVDEKAGKAYSNSAGDAQTSVFDFINKKLGHKKGHLHDIANKTKANTKSKKSHKVNHITEKDLSNRSDHQINVQMLKTHEEIRSVENEISRLNVRLESNKGRDSGMVRQLEQKITSMETYLQQLQTSEQSLQSHKQTRSDKKKLAIF